MILERMNAVGGDAAALERYYADMIFPAAMARPGVRSGAFLAFRPQGQLMPSPASHGFVAIYRIDGAASVQAWRDAAAPDAAVVDRQSLLVSHWEPLTRRITRDDVAHTSAAALAEEERARVQMGDRILRGGTEKLAPPLT